MSPAPRSASPGDDASRKRPFTEASLEEVSAEAADIAMTDVSPSKASSCLSEPPADIPTPPQFVAGPGSATGSGAGSESVESANKKRKLTFVEKEALKIEKEHARLAKEEEKRVKEEEKRQKAEVKEEERRKKELEKAEKQAEKEAERKKREEEQAEKKKIKDAERQAKEDEKRKKDEEKRKIQEEKNKKEKAQMRLGAFFKRPSSPPIRSADVTISTSKTIDETTEQAIPTQSILESTTTSNTNEEPSTSAQSDTTVLTPSKSRSEYERAFPPFYLISHTALAPYNRFERDSQSLAHTTQALDRVIESWKTQSSRSTDLPNANKIFNLPSYKRRAAKKLPSVKEVMLKLQGTETQPIDLSQQDDTTASSQLKGITMKTFSYHEDIRPPYCGTFTRAPSPQTAQKLSRDPFQRSLPEIDYEYDSEAEWEEPGEGEDLLSEGDEEMSDEDDDMDDFLDDEEDPAVGRRKLIVSDMQPITSGLCFESETGKAVDSMAGYRMEIILESQPMSIDPFSTQYWDKPKPEPKISTKESKAQNNLDSSSVGVASTRQPLHTLNGNHQKSTLDAFTKPSSPFKTPALPASAALASVKTNAASAASTTTTKDASKNAKASSANSKGKKSLAPGETLDQLKAEISGSQLTKIGLIEVLKSKFASLPRDIIKNTLEEVARREGPSLSEKRWVLVDDFQDTGNSGDVSDVTAPPRGIPFSVVI